MTGPKSYLGKHQVKPSLSNDEMFKLARAAWHQTNTLTIPMNPGGVVIDDFHRQALINVGNLLYGERNK